jgi:hypothetical protein
MTIKFLPDGTAEITRRSPITSTITTLTLPITFAQFDAWQREGELIQRAFPHLTPDQREFLLTGITPAEWERYIKEPNDE